MADPVPETEAKPSTISELITDELISRFDDAQTTARVAHGMAGLRGWDLVVASTRDALVDIAPILIAAGRAQAATDIRTLAEKIRAEAWTPSTGIALAAIAEQAAEVAEGGGVAEQKDSDHD